MPAPCIILVFPLSTLQRFCDVKAVSEDDSDVVGRVDDQLQRRSDDVCGFLLEEDLRQRIRRRFESRQR